MNRLLKPAEIGRNAAETEALERFDVGEDAPEAMREKVGRAIFRRRGFADWAWDENTQWARGMREDCRYLADGAIEAMKVATPHEH